MEGVVADSIQDIDECGTGRRRRRYRRHGPHGYDGPWNSGATWMIMTTRIAIVFILVVCQAMALWTSWMDARNMLSLLEWLANRTSNSNAQTSNQCKISGGPMRY